MHMTHTDIMALLERHRMEREQWGRELWLACWMVAMDDREEQDFLTHCATGGE